MNKEKQYWFCLIGGISKSRIPSDGDFPLRIAVRDKFEQMFGEEDEVCASGWGVSEKKYQALRKVFSTPDEEL